MNSTIVNMVDAKLYDSMTEEERKEHDVKEREREQAEQAGGLCTGWVLMGSSAVYLGPGAQDC